MPVGTAVCIPSMFGHRSVGWLCCGTTTGAAEAPHELLAKPSFDPGREAGSLSMTSCRPSRSGCEPVSGLCASLQAVDGMLMTTYGLDAEPVRWQITT